MRNPLSQPIGSRPTGRVWLRWLVLALAVAGLITAFVNLGFWQLDRLDQRRGRNQTVLSHEDAPVRDYTEVFGPVITEADQWQRVRVSGTFDAAFSWIVRYRSNAGQQGYEVVTPLHTTDGQQVLVDRGFVARPAGEDFPDAAPQPPLGEVTVVGYVRRNDDGPQNAIVPSEGTVRLVSSVGIGQVVPYPLLDGYVTVLELAPAAETGLEPIQPPELTEGNHFSYAIQWFTFSGIAAIGLVILIRSDLKGKRPKKQAA
ncbi:MAG: SURF1 family protein [Propionicimonas sp.]|uniref:SURF1 family cytochrome oxidase biogenesis protein n=1 Tax=Propionicimonas sp. TaxID=1955623 RepID=UPI002B1FC042|nr:SURF1 family protein [Propionicimonas sp.]MEA4942942.1 SURF1 family protein [Propionicimonas sp.]